MKSLTHIMIRAAAEAALLVTFGLAIGMVIWLIFGQSKPAPSPHLPWL